MRFQVIILPRAREDLLRNDQYIAERSPSGAQSWRDAFQTAVDSLERNADLCPLAPESQRLKQPVRQISFKTRHGRPFRVLFVIRDDRVYLLHIRGPGQNLLLPDEVQLPDE